MPDLNKNAPGRQYGKEQLDALYAILGGDRSGELIDFEVGDETLESIARYLGFSSRFDLVGAAIIAISERREVAALVERRTVTRIRA